MPAPVGQGHLWAASVQQARPADGPRRSGNLQEDASKASTAAVPELTPDLPVFEDEDEDLVRTGDNVSRLLQCSCGRTPQHNAVIRPCRQRRHPAN